MSPRAGPAEPRKIPDPPAQHQNQRTGDTPAPGPQDEVVCLLVGVDRRAGSQVALTTAAALATRLGARLEVVHVVDLSDYPIDPDSPHWEAEADAALDEQRRQVSRALALFTGEWAFHVRRGAPASVLATMAQDCNALMIVLAAAQRGAAATLARMVDGSIVRELAAQQRCRPVLVVPAGTPQDSR